MKNKITAIILSVLLIAVFCAGCKKETVAKDIFFVVDFETNGGSDVAPQIVKKGGHVEMPGEKPTLEGADFLGWSKYDDDYIEWEFEREIVLSNMTLYAIWDYPKEPDPDPDSDPVMLNPNSLMDAVGYVMTKNDYAPSVLACEGVMTPRIEYTSTETAHLDNGKITAYKLISSGRAANNFTTEYYLDGCAYTYSKDGGKVKYPVTNDEFENIPVKMPAKVEDFTNFLNSFGYELKYGYEDVFVVKNYIVTETVGDKENFYADYEYKTELQYGKILNISAEVRSRSIGGHNFDFSVDFFYDEPPQIEQPADEYREIPVARLDVGDGVYKYVQAYSSVTNLCLTDGEVKLEDFEFLVELAKDFGIERDDITFYSDKEKTQRLYFETPLAFIQNTTIYVDFSLEDFQHRFLQMAATIAYHKYIYVEYTSNGYEDYYTMSDISGKNMSAYSKRTNGDEISEFWLDSSKSLYCTLIDDIPAKYSSTYQNNKELFNYNPYYYFEFLKKLPTISEGYNFNQFTVKIEDGGSAHGRTRSLERELLDVYIDFYDGSIRKIKIIGESKEETYDFFYDRHDLPQIPEFIESSDFADEVITLVSLDNLSRLKSVPSIACDIISSTSYDYQSFLESLSNEYFVALGLYTDASFTNEYVYNFRDTPPKVLYVKGAKSVNVTVKFSDGGIEGVKEFKVLLNYEFCPSLLDGLIYSDLLSIKEILYAYGYTAVHLYLDEAMTQELIASNTAKAVGSITVYAAP